MVELLSRIAWRAHVLQQRKPDVSFTTHEVKDLLKNELDIRDKTLAFVIQGVLLTLTTALGSDDPAVHFTHKSFREFLVAKYWESRLRRIVGEPRANHAAITSLTKELMSGRLFAPGDASANFLVELCLQWSPQDRKRLSAWAQQEFNDETLSSQSLRDDQRYILREAALMLGSLICEAGLEAAGPHTLETLCAVSHLCTYNVIIRAPRLKNAHASLVGTNLEGANLKHADLEGANLTGANLTGANLEGANLKHAFLVSANLQFATFTDTNLEGANLYGAILYGTNLNHAILAGANLERVLLQLTDLSGANLSGAILSGAILSDAKLERAILHAAILHRTNLDGADLLGADLLGANLTGAILSDANLEGANLEGAKLADANLEGANLAGANLDGANLDGALLEGAYYNAATVFPHRFSDSHFAVMQQTDKEDTIEI